MGYLLDLTAMSNYMFELKDKIGQQTLHFQYAKEESAVGNEHFMF